MLGSTDQNTFQTLTLISEPAQTMPKRKPGNISSSAKSEVKKNILNPFNRKISLKFDKDAIRLLVTLTFK